MSQAVKLRLWAGISRHFSFAGNVMAGHQRLVAPATQATCSSAAFVFPPTSPARASSLAATSPAPTPAPSFGTTPATSPESPLPEQQPSSDSTPIVVGVVSAVAGAALIALAVFLRRRRSSKPKIAQSPLAILSSRDDNLEQGGEYPPDARPRSYSEVVAAGHRGRSWPSHQHYSQPHGHTPAEANEVGGGGVILASAPASVADEDAAGGSAEKPMTATNSIALASTADVSTTARDKFAHFRQSRRAADVASVAGRPKPGETSDSRHEAFSAADGQTSAGDIGLGQAVLAAAQELARQCQVPGVSEAAAAVCIMANLVTDSHENERASESRLRHCRAIVMALERAAKVAEKVR